MANVYATQSDAEDIILVKDFIERFAKVYDELVDETENKLTLTNRRANDRLKDALALMEYLRGENNENPLDEWFDTRK